MRPNGADTRAGQEAGARVQNAASLPWNISVQGELTYPNLEAP